MRSFAFAQAYLGSFSSIQKMLTVSTSGGPLELPSRNRAPMTWHQIMGHKGTSKGLGASGLKVLEPNHKFNLKALRACFASDMQKTPRETSCHLLATDTGHSFRLQQETNLGATVEIMFSVSGVYVTSFHQTLPYFHMCSGRYEVLPHSNPFTHTPVTQSRLLL